MTTSYWKVSPSNVTTLMLTLIFFGASAYSQTNGLKANLRSSAAVLTPPIAGGTLPTAPTGGVVVTNQAWVCDACDYGFETLICLDAAAAKAEASLTRHG